MNVIRHHDEHGQIDNSFYVVGSVGAGLKPARTKPIQHLRIVWPTIPTCQASPNVGTPPRGCPDFGCPDSGVVALTASSMAIQIQRRNMILP